MPYASGLFRRSLGSSFGVVLSAFSALNMSGAAPASPTQSLSTSTSCKNLGAERCRRMGLAVGTGRTYPDRPRSLLYLARGCKSPEDRQCPSVVTVLASGRKIAGK